MTEPNRYINRREDSTSWSLLERAKLHDPAAWDRVVDLYAPLVYQWARRSGLGGGDAEEVGQEVFQAVFRKLGDFRRDRPGDSFRGWLRVITENKIRDLRRRQGRQGTAEGGSDAARRLEQIPAEPPSDSGTPDPETDEVRTVLTRALEQVRSQIKETTWDAFHRVVVEGKPTAVVAEELGMTADAVDQAKRRVLRRLRQEFGELVEFGRPR